MTHLRACLHDICTFRYRARQNSVVKIPDNDYILYSLLLVLLLFSSSQAGAYLTVLALPPRPPTPFHPLRHLSARLFCFLLGPFGRQY